MSAGGKLEFEAIEWADDQADIRSRARVALGQRWAIVEYEFADGSAALAVEQGQGFFLTAGTGHRGRNPGRTPMLLFLIDDPG